ncbi:hypothetical protein BH24ACI3_BH24ACI3_03780 [soil metagenome]
MNKAGTIKGFSPPYFIAGGEIELTTDAFQVPPSTNFLSIGGEYARVVAASEVRVIGMLPEGRGEDLDVLLMHDGESSNVISISAGREIAADLHNVANPAIDPKDDAVIATMSGPRGRLEEKSLFRIEPDGYIDALPVEVMNPTGIAFSPDGKMFVSNRAAGEVYTIEGGETAIPYASGLGVATGLAFDKNGVLFVGDRSGTIYRVPELGVVEEFAKIEPSVAAYHIAFGPDGRLFVSAPGLSSYDAIYAVDSGGFVEMYFRGFGRPQGLAFDKEGNLYVAASHKGKRGIFSIEYESGVAQHLVSGNGIVGLCFDRAGNMIISTGDAVYSLPVGIFGTLLPEA